KSRALPTFCSFAPCVAKRPLSSVSRVCPLPGCTLSRAGFSTTSRCSSSCTRRYVTRSFGSMETVEAGSVISRASIRGGFAGIRARRVVEIPAQLAADRADTEDRQFAIILPAAARRARRGDALDHVALLRAG